MEIRGGKDQSRERLIHRHDNYSEQKRRLGATTATPEAAAATATSKEAKRSATLTTVTAFPGAERA
jgi:hypothetical protein